MVFEIVISGIEGEIDLEEMKTKGHVAIGNILRGACGSSHEYYSYGCSLSDMKPEMHGDKIVLRYELAIKRVFAFMKVSLDKEKIGKLLLPIAKRVDFMLGNDDIETEKVHVSVV
jgi:hypothetical protein